MKGILERLAAGDVLVCDGAMGTFLQARGLQPGECPELWCVDRPDDVKAIHQAYREAGSDLVETNTFGGTSYKLRHYDLEARATELNRAGAAIAREVAGDSQYVLGSVGPTGEFMEPLGMETEEAIYAAFKEQVIALEEGGADAVIVETFTAIDEAAAAVRATRENTGLIVIASFTFDPQANGSYRTMMGVTPARMAEAMLEAGAHILASNCGVGIDHMVNIARELRAAAPETPIMAMANAGKPVVEGGCTVFKETPEQLAAHVPALLAAGVNIIGGCCGTTPDHIRAIRQAIGR